MNKKIFTIAIIVLLLDHVTKAVMEILFNYGVSYKVIENFFYITNYHNTGAAWGIFSNQLLIIILITAALGLIIYRFMYSFKSNKRNILAFGLLIGGMSGNLLDRLLFGYVRDFLDFKIFGYDYPIFNIADSAIVIGVVLLIIAIIKGEDTKNEVGSTRGKRKNRQVSSK